MFEDKIGIKNQKLAAPHSIEKGNKPNKGKNTFDLFSVNLLLFQ